MATVPGKTSAARAMPEAFFLAAIGGFVDAFGVLTLGGLFVAHMSGNSAAFGAAFGQGNWATGLPHLVAVPFFVAGLFAGYVWMLRSPTFPRCAVILLVEAVLLAAFGLGLYLAGPGARNSPHYFAMAALPLLAMGLQNATLREVGRSVFATTYVTGVLDAMAKAAAHALVKSASGDRGAALRAGAMWAAYVAGALAGSVGLLTLHYVVLAVPVATLLILAGRFFAIGGAIDQRPSGP